MDSKRNKISETDKLLREAELHEEEGNFRAAFECLLAGANLGDSSCQVNLGNFYATGNGVRKNLKKAAYWYKKAYKNGSSCGALNLAIDRRNEGDVRSATIWFKKAIAMNDGQACIQLAKMYKNRKGGQKTAMDLLRQAQRLEISEASEEEAEALLKELTKT